MTDRILTVDFSVDILKSILWEYNKAGNLQALLTSKDAWYQTNYSSFWSRWFTNVFNLDTANDFGCNVWAIILGLPTTLLTNPEPNAKAPWGFDVFNPTNFDNFNFSSTGSSQISFTTAEKRMILKLRYRQLVSRGTIPEINKILKDIIEPIYGVSYMLDGHDMTQTLICLFAIPFKLNVILTEYDLIPREAGVGQKVVDTTIPIFGFGPTNVNFGHGGFSPF